MQGEQEPAPSSKASALAALKTRRMQSLADTTTNTTPPQSSTSDTAPLPGPPSTSLPSSSSSSFPSRSANPSTSSGQGRDRPSPQPHPQGRGRQEGPGGAPQGGDPAQPHPAQTHPAQPHPAQTHPAQPQPMTAVSTLPQAPKRMRAWAWVCTACAAECVPIRTESRCLCGHRLKEHGKLAQGGAISEASRCAAARCACARFFYIVAEGSWVLHCKCKHKHTDHDAATHKCKKQGCKSCDVFHSPWVCNCNHPWAEHVQQVVEREYKSVEQLMAEACLAEATNPLDLLQRGLD